MKLSEFVRCPIKVQRCAGRVVQTELIVQVDQRDIVPGDIVIFEPGDLFPGDIRLLSSKHLVVRYFNRESFLFYALHLVLTSFHKFSFILNSQASLTGESWTTDKTADIREDLSTPLLDLKNICFMVGNAIAVNLSLFFSQENLASNNVCMS